MSTKILRPFLQCVSHRTLSSNAPGGLYDSFGRRHDYLRISLTERCNLRCRYCMPEEGVNLTPGQDCLSLPELIRLSNIFVSQCGISKIRLTGGEPSIDRKLLPFMDHLNNLKSIGRLETIGLTSNGLVLGRYLESLKRKGLDAVNISLDTLKPERFEHMTRRRGWDRAFNSILSAIETKIQTVKVNCVIVKGFNDDEVPDFVELAFRHPVEIRFIEFMPFAGNKWDMSKLVPYRVILEDLRKHYPTLTRSKIISPNNTSKVYRAERMIGSVGFISSMSDNFCQSCNRVRLTADGNLKVCLFGSEEVSLRDLLRSGANDSEVAKAISTALSTKKKQHAGSTNLANETSRPMIKIASRSYHNQSGGVDKFTHVDKDGKINMVDVGTKPPSRRVAIAQGKIHVGHEVLTMINGDTMKKGDVISVSRVAGIMGAKMTSSLIPLCHQIPLDCVKVDIVPNPDSGELIVIATAQAHYNTGVEMESLTAVSVTLLTLYDMCKSANKNMKITNIRLLSKSKSNL